MAHSAQQGDAKLMQAESEADSSQYAQWPTGSPSSRKLLLRLQKLPAYMKRMNQLVRRIFTKRAQTKLDLKTTASRKIPAHVEASSPHEQHGRSRETETFPATESGKGATDSSMHSSGRNPTPHTLPDNPDLSSWIREHDWTAKMHVLIPGDAEGTQAQPRYARIDTGSDISIVYRSTVEKLAGHHIFPTVPETFDTLSGNVKSIGKTKVSWRIQGRSMTFDTVFYVLEDPSQPRLVNDWDFLLGKDWVRDNQVYSLNQDVWGPKAIRFLRIV